MLVGCVCFAACVFLLGLFFFRGCFCFIVFVLVGLGWGCFLSGFFFRVFVLGWVGVGVGLVDGGARQLQRSARAICGFHKSPEQGLNLSES